MFSKVSVSRVSSVLLVVMMLIGSAIFPTNVRADSIITVNSTADTYTTDGLCTLREAISNANSDSDTTGGDCIAGSGNDTIIFASSLGTATITLVATLPNINDGAGLTIDGDNRITLSGNDSVQVLYVTSGASLTLQNISVTNGNAASGAGGLYSEGTVIITHSTFSNNTATGSSGGGVANNGGTLTITNSAFSNNSASGDGGGVANISGTLTIANSTFSNNSANAGGGVINNSGAATILNSTFSGNSASYEGGGVLTWNGSSLPPTTTIRNTILGAG